jgi:hypothetical protein
MNLNYFFYSRKNLLLNSLAGIAVDHFAQQAPGLLNYTPKIKLGAGASWFMSKNSPFAFNIEAVYYLSPSTFRTAQRVPNLTFGISYFFNRKHVKKPVQHFTD